jgi:hypothetical protein
MLTLGSSTFREWSASEIWSSTEDFSSGLGARPRRAIISVHLAREMFENEQLEVHFVPVKMPPGIPEKSSESDALTLFHALDSDIARYLKLAALTEQPLHSRWCIDSKSAFASFSFCAASFFAPVA